jgi:FKBP-type peptidyl-prolyl cis-trans isomerase
MLNATVPTTKLGRWQLHYDPNIVNSKVDQANEDHCGCCHENIQTTKKEKEQMLLQKKKWQEKQQRNYTQKQLQKFSESEEYYIPYVM